VMGGHHHTARLYTLQANRFYAAAASAAAAACQWRDDLGRKTRQSVSILRGCSVVLLNGNYM
jgi:hypothetical protein